MPQIRMKRGNVARVFKDHASCMANTSLQLIGIFRANIMVSISACRAEAEGAIHANPNGAP